jgi:hypothetical protein
VTGVELDVRTFQAVECHPLTQGTGSALLDVTFGRTAEEAVGSVKVDHLLGLEKPHFKNLRCNAKWIRQER